MSGGHFEYKQFTLSELAYQVKQLCINNNIENDWGYAANYTPETIAQFNTAVELLKKAAIYVHRIDYLVSGDDGEDNFHTILAADLKELK